MDNRNTYIIKLIIIVIALLISITTLISLLVIYDHPEYLYLLNSNTRRRSMLASAIIDGNVNRAIKIIKSDKSIVDLYDDRGYTPLLEATNFGREDCVDILLKYGANPNKADLTNGLFPLHIAAQHNYYYIAESLIKHGADVNVTTKISPHETPLHYASAENANGVIILLGNNGVNVNEKNEYGLTPLHYAYLYHSNSAISELISLGADKNIRDNDGKLPKDYK